MSDHTETVLDGPSADSGSREWAQRSTSKYVRLNNQRHAELLRSRIEELDQRLALLNSERGRFERLLGGIRK
jgi:hypothetical protein